jgi:hypothetical protein
MLGCVDRRPRRDGASDSDVAGSRPPLLRRDRLRATSALTARLVAARVNPIGLDALRRRTLPTARRMPAAGWLPLSGAAKESPRASPFTSEHQGRPGRHLRAGDFCMGHRAATSAD